MTLDWRQRKRLGLALAIAGALLASGSPLAAAVDAAGPKGGAGAAATPTTTPSVKAKVAAPAKGSTTTTTLKVRLSDNTKKAKREVNVLTASRDEIRRKIDALNSEYAAQEAAVQAAAQALAAAQQAVSEANERVANAQEEVRIAQGVVQQYALETYLHPPVIASVSVLAIADTQDAGYASGLLKIMTDERHKVVENLAVKKKIAAMEQGRANVAAQEAQARSAEASVNLENLERLRGEQSELVAQMDRRLEDALAEAAALEAIDEQAARELAERELALRESEKVAQLAAATAAAKPKLTNVAFKNGDPTTTTSAKPTTGTSAPKQTTSTTTPKQTTTTAPTQTTTTQPKTTTTSTTPPSLPAGVVTWDEITYVGGIPVHKSIASKVSGLLNAATAAGFSLSGGGYRDSQSQINTRMANCGTTYYDIYLKPSGLCTPPTAIPGRSMHERGLALDLKSGGFLITSRSNPAFIWLSANAAKYGFYNLPSEPWHWSTTGT